MSSSKKFFSSLIVTSGNRLVVTGNSNTIGSLVMNSAGNIGIGTTAPLSTLHIQNASTTVGSAGIYGSTHMCNLTSGQALLSFFGKDLNTRNGYWNWYRHVGENSTSNSLCWDVNGLNNILCLQGNGNIGLGTGSPSGQLDFSNSILNRKIVLFNDNPAAPNDHQFYGFGINAGTLRFQVPGTASYRFFRSDSTTSSTEIFTINGGGSVVVNGSLSKSSGTFNIDHPLDSSKRLVHSFIEGPRCDLIYRGTAKLNGQATVNIDTDCVAESGCEMTQGTFQALCVNPVKYLHNNDSFDRVKGSISGNILTIVCENTSSNDTIDWMVVAERKDSFIKQWEHTNANGYLVTEYTKS